MRHAIYVLLALGLTTACTSCEKAEIPLAGAAKYDLTPKQVKVLETQGLTNANAAFRLSKYYSFVRMDFKQADLWLGRAARGGHAMAQYSMGVTVMYEGGDLEESKKWFSLAAAQEVPGAKEKLKELEWRRQSRSE